MQYLLNALSKAVVTASKGRRNIRFCEGCDVEGRVFRELCARGSNPWLIAQVRFNGLKRSTVSRF
jgi:hypothetical protein